MCHYRVVYSRRDILSNFSRITVKSKSFWLLYSVIFLFDGGRLISLRCFVKTTTMEVNVIKVQDRSLKIWEIAETVGVSKGMINLSARWMPRLAPPDNKRNHGTTSQLWLTPLNCRGQTKVKTVYLTPRTCSKEDEYFPTRWRGDGHRFLRFYIDYLEKWS